MHPNRHLLRFAPSMTLEQKLEKEREVTGCFLSESPFAPFTQAITNWATCSIGEIKTGDVYGKLVFPALLSRLKVITCRNGRSAGKEMAQLTWLGTDGDIESPAFPDAYEQIKIKYGTLERNKVYLVKVSPDQRNPGKVILEDLLRLSNNGFGT